MAGEWIKMRTDLADDPRVQKIADMVGVRDVDLVVGKLHRLWSYADQYTTDGTMRHMTTAILDRRFGLKGLGAALVSVGWMVVLDDEQGIVIPNFDDHNGASAKRRAMESRRKMTARRADSRVQDGGKVSAADADNNGTRRGRFAHLDVASDLIPPRFLNRASRREAQDLARAEPSR